ncbi:hypothetical protein H9L39_00188 [Fusarium oxysporum f. sp. albedinis]|nr:hypothetical protein H9L39_00188 [Fusarium oxysporum f. sp. albedinis]
MAPGSKTAGLAQVHRDLGPTNAHSHKYDSWEQEKSMLTPHAVRPGVRIISTRGFSRDVESAPDPAGVERMRPSQVFGLW